ncbi:MAG: hypothetical protein ABIJ16_02470 [Bacteroidota bacterium]
MYILLILSVISFGFGLMYLLRCHLMNYHISFLAMTETQLNDINPAIVKLFLALIHVSGSAIISIGIGTFLIAFFPYRDGKQWAWWCLLMMFTMSLVPMFYVTYTIAQAIPDGLPKSPWWLTLIMFVLMLVALAIGFGSGKKKTGV